MQKIKPINILFLLCIITAVVLVSLSVAKFKNAVSGIDSSQVAVPIINLTVNVLDIKMNPNDKEKEYVFKVSNKDENKTSEVSMEYTLEIKNTNNLPLEFELYKNGNTEDVNLLTNNKTQSIKLNLNDEEQEYKLKIKWNQENRNYQYAKVIDYVQIVLNSSQID